ncbi:MAG: hypothetical protein AAFN70_12460, partial [Planctomycetota bacterium]
FIDWWIDDETGLPIPERTGVARYFVRTQGEDGEAIVWGFSKAELIDKFPGLEEEDIMSATFIPAKLDDNPKLLEKDPGYKARLKMQPRVERERLERGNWRASEGAVIDPGWMREYAIDGDCYVSVVGGQEIHTKKSQCKRFACIDTAGTSKEKAREAAGDPPSYSACIVVDYDRKNDLIFVVYMWRSQVDWSGLKDRIPFVLDTYNVGRTYVENAHFGQPLKQEMRRRKVDLIGPRIAGMDDSSRGAKLERAIASGMLTRMELGAILFPQKTSENSSWLTAYKTELLAWTGKPKETADQIDVTSYASYVAKKKTGSWGGTIQQNGFGV